MHIPRVVLAGTHSGAGKTTIATGIMAVLHQDGFPVQGYKVGPDYIDPTYHTLATGRPSRNLDRWLLSSHLREVFARSAKENWAVIEGVMGMFDGMSGTPGYGSTADIARELKAPVILIVDGSSMARSAAALVYGYQNFEQGLHLAGVIFNRVKSKMQEQILRTAIKELDLPVLGCLPLETNLRLPERHLGLVPVGEHKPREEYIEDLAISIRQYIDLDLLIEIMQSAPAFQPTSEYRDLNEQLKVDANLEQDTKLKSRFRLGYAWDEAFLFYYRDALELMQRRGFTLIPFSPLHDRSLPPELDGLMLGGGFPELFLEQLSQNQSMLESIRRFHAGGKPIYAECGGYMYLGQSIADFNGNSYPVVGIIPMHSEMTSRLQGIGYHRGELLKPSFLGKEGTLVQGHEFHYSKVTFDSEPKPAYRLIKGESERLEGYAHQNIFASYLHLNFAGQPELIEFWHQTNGVSP